MLIRTTSEDGLKKDEIVERLQDYLQQNATRLIDNAALESYYATGPAVSRRTPFKARGTAAASSAEPEVVKSVVRGGGRRATRVKQEPM